MSTEPDISGPRPQWPNPLIEGMPSVLLVDAQGNITQLWLSNGDLMATAIEGPNAGKSVNLTYGQWS